MAEQVNYKRVTDLEMLDAVQESDAVIVERDGVLKRVPGGMVGGGVKTINGNVPDENGNVEVDVPELAPVATSGSYNDLTDKPDPVQPDWNQNDPNAQDYVKNRTHGVNQIEIGVNESFVPTAYVPFTRNGVVNSQYPGGMVKVSDLTPDMDILESIGSGSVPRTQSGTTITLRATLSPLHTTDNGVTIYCKTNPVSYSSNGIAVVYSAGHTVYYAYDRTGAPDSEYTAVLTEPGIYFLYTNTGVPADYKVVGLRWEDTITLDEKFIPDTIARTADMPTDDHINSLIDTKLGVIENGNY